MFGKPYYLPTRRWRKLYFIVLIFITFCISILLYNVIISFDRTLIKYVTHELCVIIPFRDRFDELLQLVPYLDSFLSRQNIIHHIYVINQVDEFRFNRGSLINVGFIYATNITKTCDYIVMHDVDLLPLTQELSYQYPKNGCYHVSAPHLHPRYHYSSFIGGILLMKTEDFMRINGMSNKYWGWGLEDDEFHVRIKESGITVSSPGNLTTGIQNTFRHIHGRKRKRDMQKCFNQKVDTRRRDRQTGLSNINYIVESTHSLSIDNATLRVINVRLICNRELSPWCICDEAKNVTVKPKIRNIVKIYH